MTFTVTTEELGTRVFFADPIYGEVVDFLTTEAALLDTDRQHEWFANVAEDISYTMPARETLYRKDGSGIDPRGGNYQDNHMTLALRVRRNSDLQYAFDRDPLPRTRRMVSNFMVYRTEIENEFRVNSYIVLIRNQFDRADFDLLSAERQDLLRKTDDGLKLARRVILVDTCTLPDPLPNVLM